jgi:UDP-N-acetylmuramate dehydrogenase
MFSPLTTDKLSWYHTHHDFQRYAEFSSVEQFFAYQQSAASLGQKLYVLGNGSNTLFTRPVIETIIIRNALPRSIEPLGDYRFKVSSSVPVMQLLRYCLKRQLDSFYYLASVPAQVGGALAMNAGRGKNYHMSIYDYVESVSVLKEGKLMTWPRAELAIGFRSTPFTGIHGELIADATFRFPPLMGEAGNPILDRIRWAREHQEHQLPNCGSVFSEFSPLIMRLLKGHGCGAARWSPKTINWLQNTGNATSADLLTLIRQAQTLHRWLLRPCQPEVILVS